MDFISKLPGTGYEIIILIGIFLFCFALAYFLGRGRTVALILSFYPAIFLYTQFPLGEKFLLLKDTEQYIFLNNLGIFLLFFIITFIIINTITGRSMVYTGRKSFLKFGILGILLAVLILVTFSQIIPADHVAKFVPTAYSFLSSEKLLFWFLSIPLALILILVRK